MFAGPVFTREAVTLPRRLRHYFYRSVYVLTLLILMCTCWLVVAGTQIILTVGDMARFGSTLFQVLAPLQLALVTFLAALGSASAVSQEKDRRTLILLLLTRLSNRELVLGKLFASLLNVIAMLSAPVLCASSMVASNRRACPMWTPSNVPTVTTPGPPGDAALSWDWRLIVLTF